jgi:hypothetical protein
MLRKVYFLIDTNSKEDTASIKNVTKWYKEHEREIVMICSYNKDKYFEFKRLCKRDKYDAFVLTITKTNQQEIKNAIDVCKMFGYIPVLITKDQPLSGFDFVCSPGENIINTLLNLKKEEPKKEEKEDEEDDDEDEE